MSATQGFVLFPLDPDEPVQMIPVAPDCEREALYNIVGTHSQCYRCPLPERGQMHILHEEHGWINRRASWMFPPHVRVNGDVLITGRRGLPFSVDVCMSIVDEFTDS